MASRKPAAKAASTNTQAKVAKQLAPRLDSPSRSPPMGWPAKTHCPPARRASGQ